MKNNEELTFCRIVISQKFGDFIFTQLKIDETPSMLKDRGTRYWTEPQYNHFYVFMYDQYPYLAQGVEVELNLENYQNFRSINNSVVHFDKFHFSALDIAELHTCAFGR